MSIESRGIMNGNGASTPAAVLVSAAASELSSPLVLMRQLTFALTKDTLSEAERKKITNRLILTSERALRLTTSLNVSTSSQTQFIVEPVNPISVCKEVIHELTPLFTAYNQKITLESRTRIPLSVANQQLLHQVLLGLGDNALHYGSRAYPIHMTIHSHKDKVRIGVRDYGPAIPINMWQQLERKVAKRAAAPLASRPQASGITLLAVKRLAELMGSAVGTIRHRNGATFYIDLRLSNQLSLV